jgi:integrase
MENTVIRLKDKYLTDKEIQVLLDGLPYYSKKRIMLEVLIICGLRTIEMCELHISNFSDDFKILRYMPKKQGNVKITYKRFIPKWFSDKLKVYLKYIDLGETGGYLFTSKGHGTKQTNRGYSPRTFREWYVKYRKELFNNGHEFVYDIYQLVIFPDGKQKKLYRSGLHSLRSVWVTKMIKSIVDNSKNPERDLMSFSKSIHKEFKTTWKYFRPLNKDDILLKATQDVYGE